MTNVELDRQRSPATRSADDASCNRLPTLADSAIRSIRRSRRSATRVGVDLIDQRLLVVADLRLDALRRPLRRTGLSDGRRIGLGDRVRTRGGPVILASPQGNGENRGPGDHDSACGSGSAHRSSIRPRIVAPAAVRPPVTARLAVASRRVRCWIQPIAFKLFGGRRPPRDLSKHLHLSPKRCP